MQPTAKSLVLDVLTAMEGWAAPVRALIIIAGLFGITENNLRVVLARLLSRGLIRRDERGRYCIGRRGEAVQRHVGSWDQEGRRLVRWQGGWIGAHIAGRRPRRRTAKRRQLRALDLLGFRELAPDLWVRPDNLVGGAADVRERLHALGFEPAVPVFGLVGLDEATDARARALWDVDELQAGYREMRTVIVASAEQLPRLPLEEAMVECFVLGGEALRQIAYDPLLPEPILPADERQALVHAMRTYDRQGRACWARFVRDHGGKSIAWPLGLHTLEASGLRPVATGGKP